MESTVTIVRLRSLPLSERREELETMIVSVLKSALLMGEDEELSTSESFFEMGLTSLAITEAKEHLESLLGCRISATVLFNSPTIERMTDHLIEGVLSDLFEQSPAAEPADDANGRRALWDDVMRDVCEQ
jgi:acyl carrier protein